MSGLITRIREFLFAAPEKDHVETLPERRQRWFENIMAIIMAVAAISATWASFEASRWGGKGSSLVSESNVLRADSSRWAARGAEQTSVDASVWIEWQKAVLLGRDDFAGFIHERFSPELDEAQDAWFGRTLRDEDGNPVSGKLPKGTPMALESYVPPGQAKSEQLAAKAEELLAESSVYGAVSGKYTMLTIMFALVLFFGSVATKFSGPKIQLALGSLALALLLSAFSRMLLLPII
jgi:hypothetical protein